MLHKAITYLLQFSLLHSVHTQSTATISSPAALGSVSVCNTATLSACNFVSSKIDSCYSTSGAAFVSCYCNQEYLNSVYELVDPAPVRERLTIPLDVRARKDSVSRTMTWMVYSQDLLSTGIVFATKSSPLHQRHRLFQLSPQPSRSQHVKQPRQRAHKDSSASLLVSQAIPPILCSYNLVSVSHKSFPWIMIVKFGAMLRVWAHHTT